MSRRRILAIAALSSAAAAASIPVARSTTEPARVRVVNVVITDESINVDLRRVKRGLIAEFRIRNDGAKNHNFVFGDERSAILKPGETLKLIVDLDFRGEHVYRTTVNCGGARMHGTFTVF